MALLAGTRGRTPDLGGEARLWRALPALQRGALFGRDSATVRVGNDEAHAYLVLDVPRLRGRPFPFATTKLQIGIDSYRADIGQSVLPVSGLRSAAGFEFLLEVNDTSDAQLKITPEYNPYMPIRLVQGGAYFGEHFRRPIHSMRRVDGSAGRLGFSDGNRRLSAIVRASQCWPDRPWVGLFARMATFDEKRPGYFSPSRFQIYELQGGWERESGRWTGSVGGGLGTQRVEPSQPWQSAYHVEGRVARRWLNGNQIALSSGISTSAASSAVGAFRYRTAGVSATLAW